MKFETQANYQRSFVHFYQNLKHNINTRLETRSTYYLLKKFKQIVANLISDIMTKETDEKFKILTSNLFEKELTFCTF